MALIVILSDKNKLQLGQHYYGKCVHYCDSIWPVVQLLTNFNSIYVHHNYSFNAFQ